MTLREKIARGLCKRRSWCGEREDHCKLVCLATDQGLKHSGALEDADAVLSLLSDPANISDEMARAAAEAMEPGEGADDNFYITRGTIAAAFTAASKEQT